MSLMSAPAKFQATSPPLRWDEAGGIRIGSSRVTLDSLLATYSSPRWVVWFAPGGREPRKGFQRSRSLQLI